MLKYTFAEGPAGSTAETMKIGLCLLSISFLCYWCLLVVLSFLPAFLILREDVLLIPDRRDCRIGGIGESWDAFLLLVLWAFTPYSG